MLTGAENKAFIEEKMERARSLATISESDRMALQERVAEKAGNEIEYYKQV